MKLLSLKKEGVGISILPEGTVVLPERLLEVSTGHLCPGAPQEGTECGSGCGPCLHVWTPVFRG